MSQGWKLSWPQKNTRERVGVSWRYDLGAEASKRNLVLKLGQNLWCPPRRPSRPSFQQERLCSSLSPPSCLATSPPLPHSGDSKLFSLPVLLKGSFLLLVTRTTLTTQYPIEGRKVDIFIILVKWRYIYLLSYISCSFAHSCDSGSVFSNCNPIIAANPKFTECKVKGR